MLVGNPRLLKEIKYWQWPAEMIRNGHCNFSRALKIWRPGNFEKYRRCWLIVFHCLVWENPSRGIGRDDSVFLSEILSTSHASRNPSMPLPSYAWSSSVWNSKPETLLSVEKREKQPFVSDEICSAISTFLSSLCVCNNVQRLMSPFVKRISPTLKWKRLIR